METNRMKIDISTNNISGHIYLEFRGLGEPQRFECHSYTSNHDMVGSFPPDGWAYLAEAPPQSQACQRALKASPESQYASQIAWVFESLTNIVQMYQRYLIGTCNLVIGIDAVKQLQLIHLATQLQQNPKTGRGTWTYRTFCAISDGLFLSEHSHFIHQRMTVIIPFDRFVNSPSIWQRCGEIAGVAFNVIISKSLSSLLTSTVRGHVKENKNK